MRGIPSLNTLVSDCDYIVIDGKELCAEEALIMYSCLNADKRLTLDATAYAFGASAALESIYRTYFKNYFQKVSA